MARRVLGHYSILPCWFRYHESAEQASHVRMCAEDRGPGSAGKRLDSDLEKVSEYMCVCLCVFLCVTERGDRQTEIRGQSCNSSETAPPVRGGHTFF